MRTTASFLRLLVFFIGALIIIEWVYPGDEWAMFYTTYFMGYC